MSLPVPRGRPKTCVPQVYLAENRLRPRRRRIVEEIERLLDCAASEAPAGARFGATAFIHRFDASPNVHLHYHCCVIDGLF